MKKKIILASLLTLTTVGTIMGIACGSKVNADGVATAVNSLVTKYRHNGNYTKETDVYLTDLAVNELSMHGGFHQSSKLKRTTYYTPDALWMSQDEEGSGVKYSYYGTEGENLTYGVADTALVKPNVSIAATKTHKDWHNVKEDGMEGFYVTLKDIVVTDDQVWTVSNGVYSTENVDVINWFKAFCAPCYLGFTTETDNYIDLTSASIEEVDDTLVLSLYASNAAETVLSGEKGVFATAVVSQRHSYSETTGECECGDSLVATLISSHSGTSEWNMKTSEKLAFNAVFHQNVSNVSKNGDELADFSLQIQYRGWENNGERTYFYTIKSVNGVLTIDNQLGIDPWSYTTFTLSDEHKARLASSEGLDFVIKYDHDNQKLELYIYTSHELVKLHTLNTYYRSMSNFYKFKYALTGEATVNTYTYNIYNSTIEGVYEKLNLTLTEHSYTDVNETSASCNTEGIVAHKECIMCGHKVGMDGSEVETIPMSGHTYVDGVCTKCSKTSPFTNIASHTGTDLWNITDSSKKLSSNGVFVHNVSNVPMNGDQLSDFSLQIQHKGWENNGERTYFYTIKSVNGVLTIDNQLGIAPWSYTTFTLSDEHKARLASAEGLDFYVVYDHTYQNLKLYIVTDDCVELLHTLKTYYGSMSNFYKHSYKLSGTANVKTDIYTTSSSFDAKSDLLNF